MKEYSNFKNLMSTSLTEMLELMKKGVVKTPASLEKILVGKYTIKIIKDNLEGISEVDVIKDDFVKITVELQKMKSKLRVNSTLFEAEV